MPYSAKYLSDEMSFRRNRFRRNVMDPITRNLSSDVSRVEVDVYPRVGSFKHIAEAESSNAYVSAHESLVLQPFMFQWIISYRFLFILFDKIKMELFILYLINMRSQVTSSKF